MRRTLRTDFSDTVEHLCDSDCGRLRRDPRRRILPRDIEGAFARMRIGAVQHPAVVLAFSDGAGFLQHGDRPTAQRPDLRPFFLLMRRRPRWHRANAEGAQASEAAAQAARGICRLHRRNRRLGLGLFVFAQYGASPGRPYHELRHLHLRGRLLQPKDLKSPSGDFRPDCRVF